MGPPAISLDTERLDRLIELRHGGVPNLLERWHVRFGDGSPDRSTVYNWKNGRTPLPRTVADLLRLAILLDCDPIMLLDFGGPVDASLLDAILQGVALDLPQAPQMGTLSLDGVFRLLGVQKTWPNSGSDESFEGLHWHVQDFEHDGARQNVYQTIEICPSHPSRPLVWHFAFHPRLSRLWRPYGFVVLEDNTFWLNNFFEGRIRSRPNDPARPLDVSTYFGPSLAGFRIASLHPFTIGLVDRTEEYIRFIA